MSTMSHLYLLWNGAGEERATKSRVFPFDRPGFKFQLWHPFGKWPNLSELQFTHLQNEVRISTSLECH